MARRGFLWLAAIVLFALVIPTRAEAASVTVAWDAPVDPTVTGYVVSYGTASGAYGQEINVGNVIQYTVTGLAPNQTYYFAVQSYNASGVRSAFSAEVVFQPLAITCHVTNAVSTTGNPIAVTLVPPDVIGATGTVTTTCTPPSGSLFPVGNTPLSCSATDTTATVSCTSVVSVSYTPPPPNLLVSDTFTGTAGTALPSHTPDVNLTAQAWTVTGAPPTPALVSGRAGVAVGAGHVQATINSGVADIQMAIDYVVGTGPGMGGLAFRETDTNNLLVLLTYLNTVQLYRRQGGMWTLLASQPIAALAVGSTHRLEVHAVGSSVQGWWDGVQLLQVTESFQKTATRHGLDWNSAYDPTSTYDNFTIKAWQ